MTYIPDPTAFLGVPVPASGAYFFPTGQHSASTAALLGNGTLRVAPWVLSEPLALSRVAAEITTVGEAGSKLRLGIYADNGNGYPGALTLDAGQINGDSATVQELTVAVTLTPGLYWIGGVIQSAPTTPPTIRVPTSHTYPASMPYPSLPTAGVTASGVALASVTGALPATFTAGQSPSGTAPPPRLIFKVA